MTQPHFTSQEIVAARGARNAVDPLRPYAMLLEEECGPSRTIDQVATIFLTNRECPYRCLMCDLWQNTTEESVPEGAIPAQIQYALMSLGLSSNAEPNAASTLRRSQVRHLKLYNSGNFFDAKAIPPADHQAIARLVTGFETVIVENHPNLCDDRCGEFQQRIGTQVEVAMGLETIHPEILPALNKQMTADDFARACERLLATGIRLRAFILLRTPGMSRSEGVEWALRSTEFAFAQGVDCCAIIPTRTGNRIMERLENDKCFAPPTLADMEATLQAGIEIDRGRVFVDLWDARRFADCSVCADSRIERLRRMNLRQSIQPPIACAECT